MLLNDRVPETFRKFLLHIPLGEEAAVSMPDLARVLGMDERTVRAQILRARSSGCVIASTDAGYFIPSNEEELRRYVCRARAIARSHARSMRAAEHALERAQEEEFYDTLLP